SAAFYIPNTSTSMPQCQCFGVDPSNRDTDPEVPVSDSHSDGNVSAAKLRHDISPASPGPTSTIPDSA
ncbi:hypothetical protein, partial [Corynebacterium parakroppenstedtii]|uniref:hypothetical protein n=1 Tax=Corynebacterium parakroppenstedtii TaxID=2828363 RepID=UPI0030EB914D